ncbi:hypothetical protein JCM16303_001167 [Sporobolomyces ruberrimus]
MFSGCLAEHLFCYACLDAAPRDHVTCPTCRGPRYIEAMKESPFINRLIQDFAVKCTQSGSGCGWTGPFSNLQGHKISCDFKTSPCPKVGCDFVGTKKAIAEHAETTCKFTPINCPRLCGIAYKRGETEKHEDVCTAWPCQATEGCKTKTTKKFLRQHEAQCKTQTAQVKKAKHKLKNVTNELRRKRKAAAKQAEKAKEANGNDEDPIDGASNLIPTAHEGTDGQGTTKAVPNKSKGSEAPATTEDTTKEAEDGDAEMTVVEGASTSTAAPKKRKRGKKTQKGKGKAKAPEVTTGEQA